MRERARATRGFSLLEAAIASVTLAVIVLAVGAAVSAGRQQSIEGEKQILAAIAADDLLSELRTVAYANLDTYDAFAQAQGSLATLQGVHYPDTYWQIGRSVTVQDQKVTQPDLGVIIKGKRIVVAAHDDQRVLASIETFVPEPPQ